MTKSNHEFLSETSRVPTIGFRVTRDQIEIIRFMYEECATRKALTAAVSRALDWPKFITHQVLDLFIDEQGNFNAGI